MARPEKPICDKASAQSGETCERVLDAAEVLFAAHGFSGASVRDITSKAECNLASVNYHFGGKDNLYLEVFNRRVDKIVEQRVRQFKETLKHQKEPHKLERILRAFSEAFFAPLLESGKGRLFMHIMAWELADPHLPPGLFNSKMIEPMETLLLNNVKDACPWLDNETARRCFQSLVAQLIHLMMAKRIAGGKDDTGLAVSNISRFKEHIIQFTAGGMRAFKKRTRG